MPAKLQRMVSWPADVRLQTAPWLAV